MGVDKSRQELDRLKARIAELERLLEAREQPAPAGATPTDAGLQPISGHAEALHAIAAGTAAATGDDFFHSLAANLASALKVRYVYVGVLCEPGRDRVATVAAWAGGQRQENIEYVLAGTPCEQVVIHGQCYYCQDVQRMFPHDRFLVDMGIQSYCGAPLVDRSGRVLGLLDVLHDQPMGSMADIGPIMAIFADRAAAELNRLQAETILKKREAHLQAIIEMTPGCVKLVDADGTLLAMNQAGLRMIEAEGIEAAVGKSVYAVIAPEYRDAFRAFNDAVCRGSSGMLEFEIVGLKGRRRRVETRAVPLPHEREGRLVHLAITHDITELRRAEEALRERTTLLQTILDHSPAMVFLKDREGRYLLANRRFEQAFHLTREAVVGRTDAQLFPPGQAAAFSANDRRVLQSGVPMEFEEVAAHDDGPHTSIVVKFPLYNAEGAVFGIGGIATDVTERKRAEEGRKHLAAILEATTDFVGTADREGRVLFVNRAGRRLLGIGEDEDMTATRIVDYHPEWAARLVATEGLPAAARDGVWSGETALRTREGVDIPVSQVILGHKTPEGAIAYFSTIARDLRDRKQLEERLRQAAKMEAVGRLAGGIAHDFNNLLTVILGHSDMLLRRLAAEDSSRRHAGEIKKAGSQAAHLTGQLLAFSRKQVIQPKLMDLNQTVSEMADMLRRLAGENIRLIVDLEPRPCLVKADPGQIEQVLMNLVANARDAMPETGTLTIGTSLVEGGAGAPCPDRLPPGVYVRLTVSDSGCGMDADTRSRVFEPFFTTKELGKGTGLGLATVYGIVVQNGGAVEVDSLSGRGTTFRVFLPRAEGVVPADASVARPARKTRHTETLLLVEDDLLVREFLHRYLVDEGFRVFEAASGEEALQLCRTSPEVFHLLVTDVVMPGMSGRALAEQAVVLRPAMKVLLMSGYTDDVVLRHGVSDDGLAFLSKPFLPDDLTRKIRDVLDGPQGSSDPEAYADRVR